jgi:hypothetical protein
VESGPPFTSPIAVAGAAVSIPDFSPAPHRRCVTSRAAAFLRNSAADPSEQIGPNLDEATTRQRLKGVKSSGGASTCSKSAIGGSGRKSSVVPLRISRATGPRTGTICSRAVGGVALLGATWSWVRGIGLLSRRVAGGIALLGECERGGSKRDSDHEAQSFHAGHFAFSYLPTTRLTPPDEAQFHLSKMKSVSATGTGFRAVRRDGEMIAQRRLPARRAHHAIRR